MGNTDGTISGGVDRLRLGDLDLNTLVKLK